MIKARASPRSPHIKTTLFSDLENDVVITVIANQVNKKRFRNHIKTELGRTLIGRTPPATPDLYRFRATPTVFSRVPGRPSAQILNLETDYKPPFSQTSPGFYRTGSLPHAEQKDLFLPRKKWVSPFQTRDIALVRKAKRTVKSPVLTVVASSVPISPVRGSPTHTRSVSKRSPADQFFLSPFTNTEPLWKPGKPLGRRLQMQTIRKIRESM